jgi:replicative DNA helicase
MPNATPAALESGVQYRGRRRCRFLPLSGHHNDDPGRDHAVKVAEMLSMVARSVKVLEPLPGVPHKGDATDWVNAGGTLEQLRELYKQAQAWAPGFEFASAQGPVESDKYIRTMSQEIEEAGGMEGFWSLANLQGIETAWTQLSHALGGGMRSGEVYIAGGNQGSGKTSLVLRFMSACMKRGQCPLMFSMEMGHRAVFQRMAGIEACVNLKEFMIQQITIRRRDATEQEKSDAAARIRDLVPALHKATAELSGYPLLVSTQSSVTPEQIAEETLRLQKKRKINLLVIDHMQLMGSTGSARGDYEKFTNISRTLKQTAVELHLPILLVSQTSRAQAKDKRAELEVADLRGSGALEEDAAAVMLLYEDAEDAALARAEGGDRYTNGPTKACLKLGKNRYGEQGKAFSLLHYKAATRFDMEDQ